MPALPINRVTGGLITAADINAIAGEVNAKLDPSVADQTYAARKGLTSGSPFYATGYGSRIIRGWDEVDGLGYFISTAGFYTSVDNATLSTVKAMPPGVTNGSTLQKIVRFGDYLYTLALDAGDNIWKVFRALPPGSGNFSWSAALVSLSAGSGGIGTGLNKSTWTTGQNYLYLVEYGDPAAGPRVLRSPDGLTWEATLGPIAGLRHMHAVWADTHPDYEGHVYATCGDGQSKTLYRSTDRGATWNLLLTDTAWQGVQISGDDDYVYFAGDAQRTTLFAIDRDNPTVPVQPVNWHGHIAVPGGLPTRGLFTDGALTSGSKTFTSATAAFTAADVGKSIRFTGSVPLSLSPTPYITGYTNATTVTLSNQAGGAATGVTFAVEGDAFFRTAFYGAVDPDTGIYYALANDSTSGGTRSGMFICTDPKGRVELLEAFPLTITGEVFFGNGRVFAHQSVRPVLTAA